MKYLLTLLLLFTTNVLAAGGTYYNPERSGEGVSVFIRGETLAFQFYTYYDRKVTVTPIPSPAPPPPVTTTCANEAVWYIGISNDWNGVEATGDLFLSRPNDYPNVGIRIDGTSGLNEMIKIGTFSMLPDAEGFDLIVESSGELPPDMFLFNNRFSFNKLLIE